MSCEMLIRRYISSLPFDQIFTTGEVLRCGLRAHVDCVMSYLVKTGEIQRLARGVFIRDTTHRPSVYEVAVAKARRFGKEIVRDCPKLLKELKLSFSDGVPRKFPVNGRSSSFEYGSVRVIFKSVSARKLELGETTVGKATRALWYAGNESCTHMCNSDCPADCPPKLLRGIARSFNRRELEELILKVHLMPAWLTNLFWKIFKRGFRTSASLRERPKSFPSDRYDKESRTEALRPALLSKALTQTKSNNSNLSDLSNDSNHSNQAASPENSLAIKRNPKLKEWLALFPLDRRIIYKDPDKTLIVIFDHATAMDPLERRAAELDYIATKYPQLSPSKFLVNTEQLRQAAGHLRIHLQNSS